MSGSPWQTIAGAGAVLAVAHLALPDAAGTATYTLLGMAAVALFLVALRDPTLARRDAWGLLAAATALSVTGDLLWAWFDLRGIEPFPSVADVVYLAAYPLYAAGLWRLGRRGDEGDEGLLVDVAIFGVAAFVVLWGPLLQPFLLDDDGTLLGRIVGAAYPAGDLLLVPFVARLVFLHGRRTGAHLLVLLAIGSMLVADLAYATAVVNGTYAAGHAIDALWLIGYVWMAAAAWHPSARTVPPLPRRTTGLPRRRLVALTLACLLAPLIAIEEERPTTSVAWVASVGTLVLFLLVVRRLAITVKQVEAQAAELDRLSRTDALTGAANRRALDDALELALAAQARSGRPLTLALLDLDHFKDFNDEYGHPAGDRLLQEVVERWQVELRATDVLARYGGEEFAVLFPDTDLAEAVEAVERLRAVVPGAQTCSAGVAGARPGLPLARLVRLADDALYAAKDAGRDRVEVAASHPHADVDHADAGDPPCAGPATR